MFPQIKPSALTKVYSSLAPSTSQSVDTVPTPGDVRYDSTGKVYKFVKNLHSSALAVGDVVMQAFANAVGYEVNRMTTATLNMLAGVAVGAIPASGYGWIQIEGDNDTILMEGTSAIAIGDSLKGVNAQLYLVKDAATGTEATYARHVIAREAYNTGSAATKKGTIRCR